jgi:hypothetical protein
LRWRDYFAGRMRLQEEKGGDPQGGGEGAARQDRRTPGGGWGVR